MTEFMTSALAGVTYGVRGGARTETGVFISLPQISLCMCVCLVGAGRGRARTVLSLKMFLSVASPCVWFFLWVI